MLHYNLNINNRPTVLPVFEEPVDAKCHKFEQSLDDEDDGEHVVTVLQHLL